MIRIANPTYDAVFKYLLTDDNRVAMIFLSKLTDKKIIELTVLPNEVILTKEEQKNAKESLTVYRLDFAATIELKNGDKEVIIIEMQKAKYLDDIMRFRDYLGSQFMNRKHSFTPTQGIFKGKKVACPIYPIYFLEHNIDNYNESSIAIKRSLFNALTNEEIENNDDRKFTNSLFHQGLIIQIPKITKDIEKFQNGSDNKVVNKHLGRILTVFNQKNRDADTKKYIIIDDKAEKKLPKWLKEITRSLEKAGVDKDIRAQMKAEDAFYNDLKDKDREFEVMKQENKKQKNKISEEKRKRKEADKKAKFADKKAKLADKKAEELEKKYKAMEKELEVLRANNAKK